MEIFLNDQPLSIDGIEADSTVLQLLDIIEESLKGTGATVFSVSVDGEEYSPDDPDKLTEIKLMEHQRIDLLTATAGDMVKLGFDKADESLQYLESLASKVANDLRIGNTKDAMVKYVDFVDGLEWLVTMLKNAYRAFAANMSESSIEADRENLIKRLSEQTAQINACQEGKDWIGLADVLEYEFTDIFSATKELIHKITKA